MNKKIRGEIFERFKNANLSPKTELNFSSNFELLVAVMLSAQATDNSVNIATAKLFKKANTPAEILALGEERLSSYIKNIGLYNTKARNILKTSEILIQKYKGQVPATFEDLESLPGVGRKTANVVLNCAFHQPTMPVDTHVFRVANRTGLARGKTPLAVEKKLLKCIEKKYLPHAHHWLILHGRYVCVARRPKCGECIINDLCEFSDKLLGPLPSL